MITKQPTENQDTKNKDQTPKPRVDGLFGTDLEPQIGSALLVWKHHERKPAPETGQLKEPLSSSAIWESGVER